MNVTNELYTTLGNINYDSLILGKGLQMLAACSQIKWTLKKPVAKLNFRSFHRTSVVNILIPAIEVLCWTVYCKKFPFNMKITVIT